MDARNQLDRSPLPQTAVPKKLALFAGKKTYDKRRNHRLFEDLKQARFPRPNDGSSSAQLTCGENAIPQFARFR